MASAPQILQPHGRISPAKSDNPSLQHIYEVRVLEIRFVIECVPVQSFAILRHTLIVLLRSSETATTSISANERVLTHRRLFKGHDRCIDHPADSTHGLASPLLAEVEILEVPAHQEYEDEHGAPAPHVHVQPRVVDRSFLREVW